jgi:serine/threonine protein kinase
MKTLSKSAILGKNHVGMVMKERNLLAKLHCPQLVNMHYAFQVRFEELAYAVQSIMLALLALVRFVKPGAFLQDERRLYILMDLCLGGDLHFQLTQIPARYFPEEQARFYVASIVLALEYMHKSRVLHRDM